MTGSEEDPSFDSSSSEEEGDGGKDARKRLKLARDVYKKKMLDLQEQVKVLQQKNTHTTSSSSGTSGASDNGMVATGAVVGKELTKEKQKKVHSFMNDLGWARVKFMPHDDEVVYKGCPTLLPALLKFCHIETELDKAKYTTMAKKLFKYEINQKRHNLVHPIRDKYRSECGCYV